MERALGLAQTPESRIGTLRRRGRTPIYILSAASVLTLASCATSAPQKSTIDAFASAAGSLSNAHATAVVRATDAERTVAVDAHDRLRLPVTYYDGAVCRWDAPCIGTTGTPPYPLPGSHDLGAITQFRNDFGATADHGVPMSGAAGPATPAAVVPVSEERCDPGVRSEPLSPGETKKTGPATSDEAERGAKALVGLAKAMQAVAVPADAKSLDPDITTLEAALVAIAAAVPGYGAAAPIVKQLVDTARTAYADTRRHIILRKAVRLSCRAVQRVIEVVGADITGANAYAARLDFYMTEALSGSAARPSGKDARAAFASYLAQQALLTEALDALTQSDVDAAQKAHANMVEAFVRDDWRSYANATTTLAGVATTIEGKTRTAPVH